MLAWKHYFVLILFCGKFEGFFYEEEGERKIQEKYKEKEGVRGTEKKGRSEGSEKGGN